MNTKEKILDSSRILFNTKGLNSTTARTISTKLGISVGNFSYHFPSKDKIVEELYENMLKEMQHELSKIATSKINIITYLESHKVVFNIQLKYKFIYLNLFEVLNKHPKVKSIYLENVDIEKSMANTLLKIYVDNGVLKPIEPHIFEKIRNVGHILHNTWLVEAEILFKGNKKEKLKNYLIVCCGLLEPYLSDESLKEYNLYFDNVTSNT